MAGGGVLQLVDLDDDRITEFFTKTRPLVMLNGCEGVLPGAVLTLRDTFPHRFMRLEAAAFIGTLWPVESRGAALFAGAFYAELAQGKAAPRAVFDARNRILAETGEASPKFRAIQILAARAYVYYGPHDLVVTFNRPREIAA